MTQTTKRLAEALDVVGLLNIQYAIQNDTVYVLEVNPRASRTVPFVSKATGTLLAQIATRAMIGEKLDSLHVRPFDPAMTRVAIKESVFPFTKFPKVNVFLGPEMRSTGEVMGMDSTFGRAIVKSHISAGNTLPATGNVFISLSSHDKSLRAAEIARGYAALGFTLLATKGTAAFLADHGVEAKTVLKHYEGRPSVIDSIADGGVQLVINTPLGENARYDEYVMGHTAMKYKVPFFTTLAAAEASLAGIRALREETLTSTSLQEHYASASTGH
jgi:carbamoyl-phosphate synthase large subunit